MGQEPTCQRNYRQTGAILCPTLQRFRCARKLFCWWMAAWPYRRTCHQQYWTDYTTTILKKDVGDTYVPRERNDLVQLDFWVPLTYVHGRKKYLLMATDIFSHWPSACACSSNKSKKVLRFLRKYINTHSHVRKLHMDQAAGFFSKDIPNFCN